MPRCIAVHTIILSLTIMAAPAPAQVSLDLRDSALDGRMVVLGNGLVEVRVAPQLGGRLLGLDRPGLPALLRDEADYSQTREALWTAGGGASLSYAPADAWVSAGVNGLAAVRWERTVTVGDARLRVVRELALQEGLPAAHFRVTVHNVGEVPAQEVGYSIRPHFRILPGLESRAAEALPVDTLRRRDTRLEWDAFHVATPEVEVVADFPAATFTVIGESYMFRVHHDFPLGDIVPGGRAEASGRWWLLPPGDIPPQDAALNWALADTPVPVEPLVVSEEPPADLPSTPLAADLGPWGLCDHSGPAYLPLWQAAGVKWLRTGFGWGAGEPAPGEYRFDGMDAKVDAAEQAGVQIVGYLLSNPPWATVDGNTISPPRDLSQWERYVETLTRRYRGRVHVWEIWNEPDIGQFWSGTVEDYVDLLAAAFRGARRGDPDALVMSAGLNGPGERYLVRMIELGAMDHCDLVGFHPYAGNPELAEARMRAVWRILNTYGIRKPVWITELGWQSGGWREGPGVVDSEQTKAAYLQEAYQRIAPLSEVICWYVDKEGGDMFGLTRPRNGGLVLNDAYHAFREQTGAAADETLTLDGPDRVTAYAGATSAHSWRVRNGGDVPLEVRASVYEPHPWAQVTVSPEAVAAGEEAVVELTLTPPEWAVTRVMPAVLVAWSPRGPATVVEFELEVHNDGDGCEVGVGAQWGIRTDGEGGHIGSWTPTHSLVIPPGGHMHQPFRVYNHGTATERFDLSLQGPAVEWARPIRESISVRPGENEWVGVHVDIPPDAGQGVYALTLTVTSARFPEVSTNASVGVKVGPGGE